MIFGRSRTTQVVIPAGTFLVPFGEWPEGTPWPVTCVEGVVVASDSHVNAERRADDVFAQLQGARMPRCPVRKIDMERPGVKVEIPRGRYLVQSKWTPTSSPIVKNCWGMVVLADSEREAQVLYNDIIGTLVSVAQRQRRFERQGPKR